ncbi:hypothetical protein [Ancylobacter defluvii]|nr:hypothetical protein [Ancylobacter defluvii]MBS7587303.1 hypothetical protein [Ancylobacter defluvii]
MAYSLPPFAREKGLILSGRMSRMLGEARIPVAGGRIPEIDAPVSSP